MKNIPDVQTTPSLRAFTLVELAVVLVIIGLLVGGIASFRTYTANARLNSMMNESKILISAFNQFQTRYGTPPGDMSNASASWTGAGNGDGNGLIRASGSLPLPLERYYAFQHLALAGFIQGTYTGAVNGAGGATAGLNVVGTSVDKSAFMFDHPDEVDGLVNNATVANATYFDGLYGNILRVAGLNDNSASIPDLGFLTPKDALTIDLKYDDGQPGLGNIKTPKSTALTNCATTDVNTTAAYTTSNDGKTCYLFLGMQ